MKLYIKQRIFSLGDKYDISDVNGNAVFHVTSELFTIGAKLHLMDTYGRELFYIKRKITFMLARYEIYQNDTLYAAIKQEWSFFKARLHVESFLGRIEIQGDFLSREYEIIKDGLYFGSVHKKWFTWGDSYELDIPDDRNAAFFCALVIAIDNCLHNENK